jgi:hypothetical protein
MEAGRRIKNIAKKRSLSGEAPGGRFCLSFPMRTLGLRPCISMGRRSKSKYDCHLLFFYNVYSHKRKENTVQIRVSNIGDKRRTWLFGCKVEN